MCPYVVSFPIYNEVLIELQFFHMPRVFGAPFESEPIDFSSKSIGVKDLQPLSYYAALTAFKRLDLIPTCDGQTDRQTDGRTDT